MAFKPACVSRAQVNEILFPYKTELPSSTGNLFPYLCSEGLPFNGMKILRYVRNAGGKRSNSELYGECQVAEDKEAQFLLTFRKGKISLRSTNYHIIKGLVFALRDAAERAATLDDL